MKGSSNMNDKKAELIDFIKDKREKSHNDFVYELRSLMATHERNFDDIIGHLEDSDNAACFSSALEFAEYNKAYEKQHLCNGEELVSAKIVDMLEQYIHEHLKTIKI